jgi:biofilm PGA synthesis N-glycosyltransferase PgaC
VAGGMTRRARQVGPLVVLVIVFVTVAITTVDAVVAKYFDGDPLNTEPLIFALGPFRIAYIEEGPPIDFLIVAGIGIALVALGSVILEIAASLRTLHPEKLTDAELHLRPGGQTLRVIALIPAHNEAESLGDTLLALADQVVPPTRVIVVADNCVDETADIARAHGAEVFTTKGNVDRKAGALNQAWRWVRDSVEANDIMLVMDADTRLNDVFIQVGLQQLLEDPNLDAVGGLFYGEPGHGLIGQLQRNEYFRYQLQIRHRQGRVFVLTGTASLFRSEAFANVAAARGTLLPGREGDVYDANAITEDNEITIALKTLGCTMTSPRQCAVETELMPTWRDLWVQRKRWQSGAVENLAEYGVTSATLRYWAQQVGIGYGTVALFSAYIFLFIMIFSLDEWVWYPFWIGLTLIFVVERVGTVWHGGWAARLIAAPLVIEIAYSFFLQMNFISSLFDIARNRVQRWGHVQRAGIVDAS